MKDLQVYNTLTRQKEVFSPQIPNHVTMYHCGPTVYWIQHIGNLRSVVIADVIFRTLKIKGYNPTFVRNYTDVGHLTGDNIGDADQGIDRMEKAAEREGITPEKIASKYINIYEHDTRLLNIIEPVYTRATDYIEQMIGLINELLRLGYAYTTENAVYFDVDKFPNYSQLSHQDLDKQHIGSGHGNISDPEKKNPYDFALWFFKTGTHANALQTWLSPFISSKVKNGEGFPGWHIECSAMSMHLLGSTIDIHLGGIEHIPIHHTNEIAQSEAVTGKRFVNYWLHNEHLLVNNQKMSKSEGNNITLDDIIKKGYSAVDLRFFFLQAHYRSKQNFTFDALTASQTGLHRIRKKIKSLFDISEPTEISTEYVTTFYDAILDDFNTSAALSVLHECLNSTDTKPGVILASIFEMDKILGLKLDQAQLERIPVPAEIQSLLDERKIARDYGDFTKSDQLRAEINQLGYIVEDTQHGQSIIKKTTG